MFLSMNWIKDFVDLSGLDELSLINQFSLSTAEVENDIQFKGSDLSGVVVAEIKSVEAHPESKKLHLLKVDIGENELVDVVCGAPNVRVGMKTAFAKVGAKIGEIEIAPRPLVGQMSYGMCCSEKEIGISDDHAGIMDITDDVAPGTDIKDVYAIDDIVFEVDNKSLTNRPDLWSHYGIAREFAAIAKRPLKPLDFDDLTAYSDLPKVDMKIEDPLCQRYSCSVSALFLLKVREHQPPSGACEYAYPLVLLRDARHQLPRGYDQLPDAGDGSADARLRQPQGREHPYQAL